MILIPAFPFHVTKQLHIALLMHCEHLPPVLSIFTLCDSTVLLELPNICSKGILFPPPRLGANTLSSVSAALLCSLRVSPRAGEGRQQRREAASISLVVDLMLLCLKGSWLQVHLPTSKCFRYKNEHYLLFISKSQHRTV